MTRPAFRYDIVHTDVKPAWGCSGRCLSVAKPPQNVSGCHLKQQRFGCHSGCRPLPWVFSRPDTEHQMNRDLCPPRPPPVPGGINQSHRRRSTQLLAIPDGVRAWPLFPPFSCASERFLTTLVLRLRRLALSRLDRLQVNESIPAFLTPSRTRQPLLLLRMELARIGAMMGRERTLG